MTRNEVYELAKAAGHSPIKAMEIAIDYERKDPNTIQWVEALKLIKGNSNG